MKHYIGALCLAAGLAIGCNAADAQIVIKGPPQIVIKPSRPHHPRNNDPGLSASESAQLQALLDKKSQAILGPGPEGARYRGYHDIPGTSVDNPCRPGYQPVKQQKEGNRTFVQCYRPPNGERQTSD